MTKVSKNSHPLEVEKTSGLCSSPNAGDPWDGLEEREEASFQASFEGKTGLSYSSVTRHRDQILVAYRKRQAKNQVRENPEDISAYWPQEKKGMLFILEKTVRADLKKHGLLASFKSCFPETILKKARISWFVEKSLRIFRFGGITEAENRANLFSFFKKNLILDRAFSGGIPKMPLRCSVKAFILGLKLLGECRGSKERRWVLVAIGILVEEKKLGY